MSKETLALLQQDHGEIRQLLHEFEAAGDVAAAAKDQIIKRLLAAALRAHTHRGGVDVLARM
ncbi:MAG TPA: hypothetical protein VH969_16460 [Actinophytocola sp.]|jgi:hypothetical protein|uniref:hypothetical protein n=1 Tax=Actinophytocola sp. TaxID=1872138 RepID=UPI002F92745D